MRILVISNFYAPLEVGGWEQLTRDIVEGLRRRGHELLVLTSRHRHDEAPGNEISVERVLHLESPDLQHYHPGYALRRPSWVRHNTGRVAEAIARMRPDVAFVHGMWNLPVEVVQEVEKRLPARVIYYVASRWVVDPIVPLRYWRGPTTRAWLSGLKRLARRCLSRQLGSYARAADLTFTRVLCVSRHLLESLAAEGGLDTDRLHVVYNSVDVDRFPFHSRRVDGRALSLLYAGRLSKVKGVEHAIEAMSRLEGSADVAPPRLSIVGSGQESYASQLRKKIESLGLRDRVKMVPWVAADQMPQVMANHDVLLFTSVHDEPLARVVQEAMASGLVVVGTTGGGMREILDEGVNALTFRAGDSGQLADQIDRLASDPVLFSQLSRRGREVVEARFAESVMLNEMERHLVEVARVTSAATRAGSL